MHCLDFIQRGFTTPDPLPEEVKRGQRALTRLNSIDNYSPMLTEPTSRRTKGFGVTMPWPLRDPTPGLFPRLAGDHEGNRSQGMELGTSQS